MKTDLKTRIEALTRLDKRNSLAKGEIWIGTRFIERAGLEDTVDNHFRLAEELGQEMVCLPISEIPGQNLETGYQSFGHKEINPSLANRTSLLAAVVDGPFQRLAGQMGMEALLSGWLGKKEEIQKRFANEQETALELVNQCLDKGVHAIILADDMCGGSAPLVNPADIDRLSTPFYTQAVSQIKSAGVLSFLHCCGNLTRLAPMIASWNLDGLAAIQIHNNDIWLLEEQIGGTFLAGIDSPLLEVDTPKPELPENLMEAVSFLAGKGKLILSSSFGLHNPDFWGRLQALYRQIDNELFSHEA